MIPVTAALTALRWLWRHPRLTLGALLVALVVAAALTVRARDRRIAAQAAENAVAAERIRVLDSALGAVEAQRAVAARSLDSARRHVVRPARAAAHALVLDLAEVERNPGPPGSPFPIPIPRIISTITRLDEACSLLDTRCAERARQDSIALALRDRKVAALEAREPAPRSCTWQTVTGAILGGALGGGIGYGVGRASAREARPP